MVPNRFRNHDFENDGNMTVIANQNISIIYMSIKLAYRFWFWLL